jgi:glycosyltransferase involved in cell wall biosynthesis
LEEFLGGPAANLVVISNGGPFPPAEAADLCLAKGIPYLTIGHVNSDYEWPDEETACYLRRVLRLALRCYFVSEGNLRLAEKQIGMPLANAEIVRNPFNVPYDAAPPWLSEGGAELRIACVGRLHPPSKGQDLLLEALASQPWKARDWRLTFYGEGPSRNGLVALADRLGLTPRVEFAGHVGDIVGVWAKHHVLALPSRYEGLPLALVEAMLCGRPAVLTDVAGHAEIVEDGVTGFLAESASIRALARALEAVWMRRADLRDMGSAAARRIRELVPPDPAQVFADKLRGLAA